MAALPVSRPPVRRAFVATCAVLAIGAPGAIARADAAPARHASNNSPAAIAKAVVTLLNNERSAQGLRALKVDKHLVVAATRHSKEMAARNQFSHQVSGEASLPTRVSRAGYKWHVLGENLGRGRHLTEKGALHIVRVWYGEKPPNDPHRMNSLSKKYQNVGVAVVLDKKHHRLWLTTDFGKH